MDLVDQLQQASAGMNRIVALFQERSALRDGPGIDIPSGPLGVEFDQVSFHYNDELVLKPRRPQAADQKSEDLLTQVVSNGVEDRSSDHVDSLATETILTNLSFDLAPGRILGLLGRTGSGKSTLTKLLFRFYDPTAGHIRLASQVGSSFDLRKTRRSDLQGRIDMVTQEVQLFHASVRDNLTLFDDSTEDQHIISVLTDVGLGDWYHSLPDGLETRLSGDDTNLSAGEAQFLPKISVAKKEEVGWKRREREPSALAI